jgi:hypothetical protein
MVVFLGIGLVGGSVIGWFWIIWAFFFWSLRLVGNRLYSQVKFKNKTNRRLAPGIIDSKWYEFRAINLYFPNQLLISCSEWKYPYPLCIEED